jgi:hypothetical protein
MTDYGDWVLIGICILFLLWILIEIVLFTLARRRHSIEYYRARASRCLQDVQARCTKPDDKTCEEIDCKAKR